MISSTKLRRERLYCMMLQMWSGKCRLWTGVQRIYINIYIPYIYTHTQYKQIVQALPVQESVDTLMGSVRRTKKFGQRTPKKYGGKGKLSPDWGKPICLLGILF